MNDRRISVVIPCHNAARFLPDTLKSVLEQTRRPIEVIVIDDGSTDRSVEIANGYGEPVRVARQENLGVCAARNRGIEEAGGEWVAFLDADDVWEPQKLERQARLLDRPETVCVHSGFRIFGETSGVPNAPAAVVKGEYTIENLLLEALVNSSTAIVRRTVPTRFPTWAKQAEDMIFFTELSREGTFAYASEILAGYRMHERQVTRRGNAWVENFENRFRWVEESKHWLSRERAETLRQMLRAQVLEWLQLARWNRQWERYWTLREYASGLIWKGEVPAELKRRLLPRAAYWLKDQWDCLRG